MAAEFQYINPHSIVDDMKRTGLVIRDLIANTGKKVEVRFEVAKSTKSRQQEKYAHACIGVVAKDIGEDAEDLKAKIKHSLGLYRIVQSNDGADLIIPKSTTDLSSAEYGSFIEAIQHMASYLNIALPQPKSLGIYDLY